MAIVGNKPCVYHIVKGDWIEKIKEIENSNVSTLCCLFYGWSYRS